MWWMRQIVLASLLLGATMTWAAENVGICVSCHADTMETSLTTGGHAETLDCVACHAERRPGRIGRRHRMIPNCSQCHEAHGDVVGHPPRFAGRTGARQSHNCQSCHAVHGSTNAALVQSTIRRRGWLWKVGFSGAGGAVPGGFVDPTNPGRGLCEICHGRTEFYPASGKGKPHYTETCTLCHFHSTAFQPEVTNANCPICHPTEAANFTKPSQHSAQFTCVDCHANTGVAPGPGHETEKPCADCHAVAATHAPPGYAFPCTQCHDPHGTDNIQLVLDAIATPQGPTQPIVFNNLSGKADGSFASASAPGTGLCEVCHTTTQFYRADGTGNPHYTFSCAPCHTHAAGFSPP